MEPRCTREADALFLFYYVRRVKATWDTAYQWCEACGYEIPYGENMVIIHDRYPRNPIQIFHEECYA